MLAIFEKETYLEVDDHKGNNYCSDQVAKIWSVLSVESLLEAVELVWLGEEEVEEGNDASLELSALVGSNGNWGEAFPQDELTDIGGNEKRNT